MSISAVEKLGNRARSDGGIDSYARWLFDNGSSESKKELRDLKSALSCWLLVRQHGGNLDKRYIPFLQDLREDTDGRGLILKPNINILSWNYDLQPEVACYRYLNVAANQIPQYLQAPPFSVGGSNRIDTGRFWLVRMNGCAGAHRLPAAGSGLFSYTRIQNIVHIAEQESAMIETLNLFQQYGTGKLDPSIDFAWEPGSMWQQVFAVQVLPALKETGYLIVIGYSFPHENSEIDEAIIGAMNPKKIHIQDLSPDAPLRALTDMANTPTWVGTITSAACKPEDKFFVRKKA